MSKNHQLDLFVVLIGDVSFRDEDEREAMSARLVALSKNKRPGGRVSARIVF